jgi:hypothetical protein
MPSLRRRHLVRRLFIPMALLVLLVAAGLAAWVRGGWADPTPWVPGSVAEGLVCQVCQPPGEPPHVRCSIRLPYSLDRVWAVVTDYEHYGDLCSHVHADRITHRPDGVCRVEARADTPVSFPMPFALDVRHEQRLQEYATSWDEPSGAIRVNRGGWTLTALGPEETLLVLTQDVQVRGVPPFIVHNFTLNRLREEVLGVERRLATGAAGKEW